MGSLRVGRHGNRRRGTGILNYELYIGRLIWNRLRYVKDPDTGKRISRPNPEDKWIIQEVPDLRIIDTELWQRVKDRQAALEIQPKTKPSGKPLIDRHRPRHLFSGLIKCGCCGGGFSMISQSLLGCSTARNKNTCDNRLTIKRELVEQRILMALRERLMEPALFAEFCQEFTREMNRLRLDATALLAGKRAELAKIERQLQRFCQISVHGLEAPRLLGYSAVPDDEERLWTVRIAAQQRRPSAPA